MKTHTKGEWKLNPLPNPTNPDYYCLYAKDGDHTTVEHIVTITSNGLNNKNEIHANAKLICAAPDLLDALVYILPSLKEHNDLSGDDYAKECYNKAIQAVSKMMT